MAGSRVVPLDRSQERPLSCWCRNGSRQIESSCSCPRERQWKLALSRIRGGRKRWTDSGYALDVVPIEKDPYIEGLDGGVSRKPRMALQQLPEPLEN